MEDWKGGRTERRAAGVGGEKGRRKEEGRRRKEGRRKEEGRKKEEGDEPANSTAREERGGLRCVVCQAAPQSTGRGRRKAGEGRLEKERSKEGVVQWGSLQREREGVVV